MALNLFGNEFKTRLETKKCELEIWLEIWRDISFVPSGLKEKRVRGRQRVKNMDV